MAYALPVACLVVVLGAMFLSDTEDAGAAAFQRELTPEQLTFASQGIVLEDDGAISQLVVTDYRCPACETLVERSRTLGAVLHINNHKGSMEAHELGLCVHRADPGMYARFERDFYALGAPELRRRLGNVDGLSECLNDPATRRRLEAEHRLGVELGARVTPTRVTLIGTPASPRAQGAK